jgi:diguanylate cyclase (GGDEF)-like protein/PAS domain S-box-containing protein
VKKELDQKRTSNVSYFFQIGILIAVFFWVFDSLTDTLVFKEADFFKNLLAPDLVEIWMRLIVMALIIGICVYSQYLITTSRQSEQKSKKSEIRYKNLAESLTEVIYRADPETFEASYVNNAIKSVYGYTVEEWLMDPDCWEKSIHPDDKERVFAILADAKREHKSVNYEHRIIRKDKTVLWVEDRITLEKDPQGNVVSLNGVVYDITARKKIEEELKRVATTDMLTGAYNRMKFDDIMAMEVERVKRFEHPLAIIFLDTDRFKEINDSYGHLTGDNILKTLAGLLREQIRTIDYLVRWGGDEFVIIVPETGLQSAVSLAERIRKAMGSYRFDKAGRITASFGVEELKKDDDVDSVLNRADNALYKAKSKGGNRVEINA